jgi:putative addiction module component (TIGR02574 family)
MTTSLTDLELSNLLPADRLMLAQVLVDSVLFPTPSTDVTPAQLAELRSRIDDIDAGRVVCEPWEQVRRRLWDRM